MTDMSEQETARREFEEELLSRSRADWGWEACARKGFCTPGGLGQMLGIGSWEVEQALARGLISEPDLPRGQNAVRWSPGAAMEIAIRQKEIFLEVATINAAMAIELMRIRRVDWTAMVAAGWIRHSREVPLKYHNRMKLYWFKDVVTLMNGPVDWDAVRAVPKGGRSLIPTLARGSE